MAEITELDKKTEEVRQERQRKFHMVEIKNDREEIRLMAEQTMKYAVELYPEMASIPDWNVVVMTTIQFVKQIFAYLASKRDKDKTEVFVDLGEFARFSVEFGTTENADKDATFNPKVVVKSELMYDNEVAENNKLKTTVPEIDYSSLETLTIATQNSLRSDFGYIMGDWRYIIYITVSFFRVVKDYLVKHKDDRDYGCIINFAEMLDFCIEKYGEEGEPTQYAINFGPGKAFKIPAKSDADSENNR